MRFCGVCVCVSEWFDVCDVCVYFRSAIYGHGFKLWISIYFLSFYILAVIIMCNLLIALIVVRGICINTVLCAIQV